MALSSYNPTLRVLRVPMALILLLATFPLVWPVDARAATAINALTVQGSGESVAGWNSLVFTPANSSEWNWWGGNGRMIQAEHWASITILPPQGQRFVAGATYPTRRFQDPTFAALDIGVDSAGCNQAYGTLTVRGAEYVNDQLSSLAVDFEHHCESPDNPALYGSFRLNSPIGYSALSRPGYVDLPTTAVRHVSDERTITIGNIGSRSVDIDDVSAANDDFEVSSDGCTGRALAVGSSCQLGVVMTPTAPGERSGTIVVSTDDLPWGSIAVAVRGTALPAPPDFVGINPVRMMDTRGGAPVAAGAIRPLRVAGRGGVPGDAGSVSMNVTVTGATERGWVTVFPCGSPRPLASNLNYVAGQTVANAVIAKVGAGGEVCFYASGTTHVIVDVNGYLPAGAAFTSLAPGRAADTRNGTGVPAGAVPAGGTLAVPVAGRLGVPADASAVVLNVTVTQPQARGWLTAYPCGEERPFASNLNFVAGQTVPNAVLSAVGGDGRVCLFTTAAAHIVVDVNGAFNADAAYLPFSPERAFDSRSEWGEPLYAGETLQAQVGEPGELTAVSMNVTATQPGGRGWITVYPCDQLRPTASNLNYLPGQTIPNAVISPVAADGTVCFYTSADTHLIVDVNGVFLKP